MIAIYARRSLALLLLLLPIAPVASFSQESRPHILVVNDDDIGSEGIAAIAAELGSFADVVVVAPNENRSGSRSSHSIVPAICSATP